MIYQPERNPIERDCYEETQRYYYEDIQRQPKTDDEIVKAMFLRIMRERAKAEAKG